MEVNTPFPPPRHPEEIFPLVVWGLIFEKLESPTDVTTCFRTCSTWKKLLESKRKVFLMHEVFPILYKYLSLDKKLKQAETDDPNSDDNSSEQNSGHPILSTRLICKSWKFGVDSFLQNPHENTPILQRSMCKPYCFGECAPTRIEQFLKMGFDPECNPFLSRFVGYSPTYSLQDWRGFGTILKTYGTHIRHAALKYSFGGNHDVQLVYDMFQKHLSPMSNLKILNVWFKRSNIPPSSSDIFGHTIYPLEDILRSNPLKRLEQLRVMSLEHVSAPLELGMILANDHVQQLKLESRAEGFPGSSMGIPEYLRRIDMPNLGVFVAKVNVEEDLLTLQSISWPIKALVLKSVTVKLDKLFEAISNSRFGSGLQLLNVTCVDKKYVGKVEAKLDLPQLKCLEINVGAPIRNIDFLFPSCNSLVQLGIEMKEGEEESNADGNNSPVIQFYECRASMLASNIWNYFPLLKHIKIVTRHGEMPEPQENYKETREFTRRQYNTQQRNQTA